MRRYAATDLPEVAGWYAARALRAPTADMLPDCGVIVQGVAAGWLYGTDSAVCLLDGYITNPAASPEDRNAALDAITGELLAAARGRGFRHVIAYTGTPSIEARAISHGFLAAGSRRMLERGL